MTSRRKGREPRDACDAIPFCQRSTTVLARQASRFPRCVMQLIFDRVAEQHGMTRRFGKRGGSATSSAARGFKYRAGWTKKTTDPKLLDTHVDKLRLRLMHNVTEYNVQPSCIHEHGRDGREVLGLGAAWLGETEAGRTGALLIGAADKRNLTISTVVTMTGTIMAPAHRGRRHETTWCRTCHSTRSSPTASARATGAPRAHARSLSNSLALGVRKQGFLHWVLLWDCASVHRKASLLQWIRTAHLECHVLFIPGGYTAAELQSADISIPAASEAQHQTAGHAISLPSPCAGTMRCLTCASTP